MTIEEIRERLNEHFNVISEAAGVVTVKQSYYWGISRTGEIQKDKVLDIIPTANIIDYGNHYVRYQIGVVRGGPHDCYTYVKFTTED